MKTWFLGLVLALLALPVWAQDSSAEIAANAVPADVAYILNSFSFLINGALVMFMGAGFAMLEGGLVRAKNTATICLKNIALYAVACLAFFVLGYNLMYVGAADINTHGTFKFFWQPDDSGAYAGASDFFFQVVFVATTASIVSGAVAERMKMGPFLIFTTILSAVIYPIAGSWIWGKGWLSDLGFKDFAGSTVVHTVGGWAALMGAYFLGPRLGRYGKDGRPNLMAGANLPMATLGTFILWLGWFAFNGGSQLALGSKADVIAMSNVMNNTNIAACGGLVAALLFTTLRTGKMDLTMALNGAIAGLVSITASPDTPTMLQAIGIGAVGGMLVVILVPLLDKLKLDDVVGAVPVHLGCGIWGTIAVAFSYQAEGKGMVDQIITQLTGLAAVGVFVATASAVLWYLMGRTIGIRVSAEDEMLGLDKAECGLEAYPEFTR